MNTAITLEQEIVETSPLDSKQPQNVSKVSNILRWLGAILLLGAALSFGIQRWSGIDFLMKYCCFLGFTASLTAAGIFCALKIGDDKGARTLLGIAAAFLPAHFAQLGAFVYASVHGVPPGLPAFFAVESPGILTVGALLAIGVPLLAAIAFFGFSALARTQAATLTAAYLAANIAVLYPTRNSDVIAGIVIALYGFLAAVDFRRFARDSQLQTNEGKAARAIIALPLLLLLGRTLLLYPSSLLFISAVAAICSASLILAGRKTEVLRNECFFFGFAAAAFSWLFFSQATLFNPAFYDLKPDMFLPFGALPVALIFAALSLLIGKSGRPYRRFASWLAIATVLAQLAFFGGLFSSVLCILTAGAIIVGAFAAEDRALFYCGSTGLALGLLYHVRYAAELYSLSPWLSLAAAGLTAVMISSYVERHGPRLAASAAAFRKHLDSWN